jgi:hypothetical protein
MHLFDANNYSFMENLLFIEVDEQTKKISRKYLIVFKNKKHKLQQKFLGLQQNCDIFCDFSGLINCDLFF